MSEGTRVPLAKAREFWASKVISALTMRTDEELRQMADHYKEYPGAVFTLLIRNCPTGRGSEFHAQVTSQGEGGLIRISPIWKSLEY